MSEQPGKPVHVETVGDMIEHGYTLDAWCTNCTTSRPVDLQRAALLFGSGALPRHLPLVCATCRSRAVEISISSPQARY